MVFRRTGPRNTVVVDDDAGIQIKNTSYLEDERYWSRSGEYAPETFFCFVDQKYPGDGKIAEIPFSAVLLTRAATKVTPRGRTVNYTDWYGFKLKRRDLARAFAAYLQVKPLRLEELVEYVSAALRYYLLSEQEPGKEVVVDID